MAARSYPIDTTKLYERKKGYHTGRDRIAAVLWERSKVIKAVGSVCPCTWRNCNKLESKMNEFQHCKLCFTIYCSQECLMKDHKEGDHRAKCKAFREEDAKEAARYKDCETCSQNYWRKDYLICAACMMRVMSA